MNNLETIISRVFEEHDLVKITIPEFTFKDGLTSTIQIASKNNLDLFICMVIDSNKLKYVNNDYQIELYSKLKANFINELRANNSTIQLNESFNKNTTLIILTNGSDSLTTRKLISSIEENAYYFKKHILSISDDELVSAEQLLNENNITRFCEQEILKIDKFKMFLELGLPAYSLITKIYEKLPFFTLRMESTATTNLSEIIQDALSEEQKSAIEIYSNLNETNISKWIDSVGIEND